MCGEVGKGDMGEKLALAGGWRLKRSMLHQIAQLQLQAFIVFKLGGWVIRRHPITGSEGKPILN